MQRHGVENAELRPENDFLYRMPVAEEQITEQEGFKIVDPYSAGPVVGVSERYGPDGERRLTVTGLNGRVFESEVNDTNVIAIFRAGVASVTE